MAATLASVCSVPLTSVLLLFELTKDYRILLPLMGAVGLAIWVPSVTNQSKVTEASDKRSLNRGYSALSPTKDKNEVTWRQAEGGNNLELCVIGNGENQEAIDEDIILEDLNVSYNTEFYNDIVIVIATSGAVKHEDIVDILAFTYSSIALQLKSSLLLHIDGTCPVAEDIGRQDVAIAAMGPIQGLPYYNWFRRRTYWLRY
ncbi:Chloride channel protein CLC-f [Camellia lanceoleosa]|uniref:Chloride channel protein CLC-f n=1 Tax=Camellia lanceoleosa TaxID=1840588 RepID=A0ACC0HED3_9ERIC|nr:Chloride channel protein CLC-f [Camellia lanceoleosa]